MGSICKSSPRVTESEGTTTSRAGPEQWKLDAARRNYGIATDVASRPYPTDTAASVEPFSPAQQLGFQATQANVGSWQPGYQQATGVAQDLSNFSLPQQDVQAYMNPYQQQVIDNLRHQFEVQQTGAYDDMRQAGVWGGRRAVREGVAQEGLQRTTGDLLKRGYDDAIARIYKDVGVRGGGAEMLAQLAGGATGLGYQDAAPLQASGALQQAQGQKERDVALQNALAQFYYPMQMQTYRQGALQGTPTAVESTGASAGLNTQSGGDPSAIMQAVFAAATLGSAFNPSGGGSPAWPTGGGGASAGGGASGGTPYFAGSYPGPTFT